MSTHGKYPETLKNLIRHHYGSGERGAGASPGVVGPTWDASDAAHMMRTWWCDTPCVINHYQEDSPNELIPKHPRVQSIGYYELMTITQMRDHLVSYHIPAGAHVDPDFLQMLTERASNIEAGFNQMRKAKEEKEALELAATKKQFGYV